RPETLQVNALVGGTAVQAQVQVLVVSFLHRVHHVLRHPHGKRQVAPDLPHHDGRPDVAGVDLHVLAQDLLHDLEGVGAVPVTPVLGAVCEGRGQLVGLGVVHLLVHTLLEVLEDDGELQDGDKNLLFSKSESPFSNHSYTT
uniref:Uncharacterized protein n=1 Tax=Oryzias melastigma TaxID=30732 RepID=A0A3B3D4B9_ORYME